MNNFQEMGLLQPLNVSLNALNIHTPTPIQAQAVPAALSGQDVLGSAQTGTGKTLAFSLPLVTHVMNNPKESALVLCPTRELAQQVFKTICSLIPKGERLYGSLLIGGESFVKQLQQLRRNPRIIVATPGRMIDHLQQNTVDGSAFSFLVLDETDRMFDMGFSMQLEDIITQLPPKRQTLMFSATISPEIERLTKKYLTNPTRISVDSVSKPVQRIEQKNISVKENEKYDQLLNQLSESTDGSIIIFVKTKRNAERIAENLDRDGHEVDYIHGDLRQNKRERVMNAFRKGRYKIMVATDVAARGLDVPHIKLVINYDLPQCPEDYIHRIGRTGRAGADGSAVNFIANHDRTNWHAIERLIDPEKFKNNKPAFSQASRQQDRFGGRSSSSSSFSKRKPQRSSSSSFGGGRKSSSESRYRSSDDSYNRFDDKRKKGTSEYSADERFGKKKRSPFNKRKSTR